MTPLDVNLQHLIASIDTDLPTADPVEKVREAQQRARSLADVGDHVVDHFVTLARGAGVPWSQIGDALGVTKQAAQQRWVPAVYEQFTNRARHAVVRAQESARNLRHSYIGTEHLLLGLLDAGDGAAAQVLAKLCGSVEAVRAAVLAAVPAGDTTPPAKIPFTQGGKEALGHANAQAAVLGHNYVGTEHLLLGLLQVPQGTAARVLGDLGVDYDAARTGVTDWIRQYVVANPAAALRIAEAKERAGTIGIRLDVAGDPSASED